jgi:hypothetical protein
VSVTSSITRVAVEVGEHELAAGARHHEPEALGLGVDPEIGKQLAFHPHGHGVHAAARDERAHVVGDDAVEPRGAVFAGDGEHGEVVEAAVAHAGGEGEEGGVGVEHGAEACSRGSPLARASRRFRVWP